MELQLMIICLPEAYLRIWPSVMISRGKNSVDRPNKRACQSSAAPRQRRRCLNKFPAGRSSRKQKVDGDRAGTIYVGCPLIVFPIIYA